LLDFVEPLGTSRNLIPVGWETELERLKHRPKIGGANCKCESKNGPGGGDTEAVTLLGLLPSWGAMGVLGSRESTASNPDRSGAQQS
jgi:hypothetical protein